MLEVQNVRLPLDAGLAQGEALVRKILAKALGISSNQIRRMRMTKRSVDARKKHDVHFVASFVVELAQTDEEKLLSNNARSTIKIKALPSGNDPFQPLRFDDVLNPHRFGKPFDRSFSPVVVGAGPAGLFCAWALARFGAKPIIVERGDVARKRMGAIECFNSGGPLDPECNVQFGEGGAGLFSDGKLTSNIKSPYCKNVLSAFVGAGAPEEILWKAKPHLGTDNLLGIVENLHRQIEDMGGSVLPRTRFEGFCFEKGRLVGVRVRTAGELRDIPADACVLACGHSARDTFELVYDAGLSMERKAFAVGVRIEHLQDMINRAQYGSAANHPALGAADYKLAVHLPDGRGVYTFCMCPGGEVVCAASEEGGVCVNGMSQFARDNTNANAAVLVGVDPADLPGDDVLAGVEFQRNIERAAFVAGGSTYAAPAQRVGDFLKGCPTSTERGRNNSVHPTYARGVTWCDFHDVLPEFIANSLCDALPRFDQKLHGFASPDAVMTGVETRSSSPARILRDPETLQARFSSGEMCEGVFPCGEGAGYAGGIMSAAVDGLRVAESVMRQFVGSQEQF